MELDIKKWHSLTLAQQMGNIGSEAQRAFLWQKKGEQEQKEKSINRFLELIDLSLADKRWQKRCLEIVRLREVLCDYFFGKNTFKLSQQQMENYFSSFAVLSNSKN